MRFRAVKKVAIVLIVSFFSQKSESKSWEQTTLSKGDTIYLLTLVDLFEVNAFVYDIYKPLMYYRHELDSNGNRVVKDNPYLGHERENISAIAKKFFDDNTKVIVVSDTTCLRGLLRDSISRRNPDDIAKACERCGIANLLVLDVQWRYLNPAWYRYLAHYTRSGMVAPNAAIPGTWWKIRVKYYDAKRKELLHNKDYLKYKRNVNYKPEATANKYDYSKFFRKPLNDFKLFRNSKY